MHHESKMSAQDMDMHVALTTLADCVEEIDAYTQKIAAIGCAELKKLLHEACQDEREHVAAFIEWVCKRDPDISKNLYTRLYSHNSAAGRH